MAASGDDGSAVIKVLVVDDERTALKAIVRLVRRAGYACLGASSGAEAKEILVSERIDVPITDAGLGNAHGLDFMDEAKRRDPDVEVVLITGLGSVAGAVKTTKDGALQYIEMPVRPQDLRRIIRQAVER